MLCDQQRAARLIGSNIILKECIKVKPNNGLTSLKSTKLFGISITSVLVLNGCIGYSTKLENISQVKEWCIKKNVEKLLKKIKILHKYFILTSALVNITQKYDFNFFILSEYRFKEQHGLICYIQPFHDF